jgi:hypothetical protein
MQIDLHPAASNLPLGSWELEVGSWEFLSGREALVDLGDGRLDLLFADRVGRCRPLPLQLSSGEAQRFDFAKALRIGRRRTAAALALRLPLLHLFLNSRVRVDESFSGITHKQSAKEPIVYTKVPADGRPLPAPSRR